MASLVCAPPSYSSESIILSTEYSIPRWKKGVLLRILRTNAGDSGVLAQRKLPRKLTRSPQVQNHPRSISDIKSCVQKARLFPSLLVPLSPSRSGNTPRHQPANRKGIWRTRYYTTPACHRCILCAPGVTAGSDLQKKMTTRKIREESTRPCGADYLHAAFAMQCDFLRSHAHVVGNDPALKRLPAARWGQSKDTASARRGVKEEEREAYSRNQLRVALKAGQNVYTDIILTPRSRFATATL